MGRLPVVIALALCACDSPPPPSAHKERTNAIAASAQKPGPTASVVTPTAPRPARKLCVGQPKRDAPNTLSDARAASGATAPPPLKMGKSWVWLNVWAAWCEPCKKEMPMLLAWRDKLNASGISVQLAFVSIDVDERELTRFLDKQPANGVRASYWLAEDSQKDWLASLGYEDEPTLPVHAFIAPDGQLACRTIGALEPTDFPSLERMFRSGG